MVTQKKMEKVQERALRFVYKGFSSSYEENKNKLVYQVYTFEEWE